MGAEGAAMARLPLAEYVHAATLMASRGFFVDERHGDGLVPAIDVANHKVRVRVRVRVGLALTLTLTLT